MKTIQFTFQTIRKAYKEWAVKENKFYTKFVGDNDVKFTNADVIVANIWICAIFTIVLSILTFFIKLNS